MTYPVSGWASTPGLDHYRHVVQAGAFDASIRKKGLRGPQGIKFLAYHDSKLPLGHINKLETRGNRLWLEAVIEDELSYGKDVALASKSQGGLNFSVGFYLLDAEWLKGPDGQEYLLITKGELTEVSVVVFPGNDEATMTSEEKAAPGTLDAVLASLAKTSATLANLKCSAQRTNEPVPGNLLGHIQKLKEALK
ncbi:hypothetical protein DXM29_05520 [Agrobacterium tumefaciens]|uniref:HK97 family phage prohead protease n=1 Tax=Agrobacterium tumefaciens TaxID=358 RepID=UPI00122FD600|nr:hypothetical protein DXM29_05520 [Agrobacterium tumefaciens]